ncbi:hypothetical protein ElyMa_004429800 [Elysia marginata]|uniref:Uncharacterized protein n=1 Tax=Elysia marginata TaxID=1093978 RepID=A0AAV4HB96_9GAST|nr:hypothetical protein ElyMa_004429800 [Elysia marginata]
MLKFVLMVCLSIALMAMYTEAISSSDGKQITVADLAATGEGVDMNHGYVRRNKRSPLHRSVAPCGCRERYRCNGGELSARSYRFCIHLLTECQIACMRRSRWNA